MFLYLEWEGGLYLSFRKLLEVKFRIQLHLTLINKSFRMLSSLNGFVICRASPYVQSVGDVYIEQVYNIIGS